MRDSCCRSCLALTLLLLPNAWQAAWAQTAAPAELAPLKNPGMPPLGTLFYSPFERAAINAARRGDAMESDKETLQIDGLVKRPRGKSTAWINRSAVDEQQPQYLDLPVSIHGNGVQLENRRLRVGENLDLVSGEQSDLLPPNAIKIKK